jgi:hypothetical protein
MNLQPDNPYKVTKAISAASLIGVVAVLFQLDESMDNGRRHRFVC